MLIVATFSIALAVQDTPVERLIALLGSDNPAVRDSAQADLLKIGVKALPTLAAFEKGQDPEVRSRIRAISGDILRQERVRRVRREPRRQTLSLQDVPVVEAVQKVFAGFDAKVEFENSGELPRKRISLSLKDADWWEAIDAVTDTAGVEPLESPSHLSSYSIYGSDSKMALAGGRLKRYRWATVGGLRIYARPMHSRGPDEVGVEAEVAFPPGLLAFPVRLEELTLETDGGRRLSFEEGPVFGASRSRKGFVTYVDVFRTQSPFSREALKGTHSLTLRGKLVVAFPRDVEIVKMDMKDVLTETHLSVGSLEVNVHIRADRDPFLMAGVRWKDSAPDPKAKLRVWLEDDQDNLVEDLPWDSETPGTSSGSIGGNVIPSLARPLKAVAARLIGTDPWVLPFAIPDIPVPPASKDK